MPRGHKAKWTDTTEYPHDRTTEQTSPIANFKVVLPNWGLGLFLKYLLTIQGFKLN